MNFIKEIEIRWSDLDPNFHLRHSVYYDFGAYCRIHFLHEAGITAGVMRQHSIGPVLFREECLFKREIKFGDQITISLKLRYVSNDFRKFSMVHELLKSNAETAAILTVDGAWMHTEQRKIVVPPQILIDTLDIIPKTDDFAIV